MSNSFHYTVMGRWPFPLDMLRYDQAEPASEVDQQLIDQLSGDHIPDGLEGVQTVNLVMRNPGRFRPNTARWDSFRWKVPGDEDARMLSDERARLEKREELRRSAMSKLTAEEREALEWFYPASQA